MVSYIDFFSTYGSFYFSGGLQFGDFFPDADNKCKIASAFFIRKFIPIKIPRMQNGRIANTDDVLLIRATLDMVQKIPPEHRWRRTSLAWEGPFLQTAWARILRQGKPHRKSCARLRGRSRGNKPFPVQR